VQDLELQRVEFRACMLGQGSGATLRALRQLFGARSATAPRYMDGYGVISSVRPATDASAIASWQRAHPDHQTFGSAPNRFFWVNRGRTDPPVISDAFAESWDAAREWTIAKFHSGSDNNFRRGAIPYHVQAAMTATSSDVHGRRTFSNIFVFPLATAYRSNLVRVT